jgi:hypothetical protein
MTTTTTHPEQEPCTSRTFVHRGMSVIDLTALHDALGCAAMAAVHAFRGDRNSTSLSLTEARAASQEAFGCGSPEADALDVVLAAITRASTVAPEHAMKKPAAVRSHRGRPSDLSRLGQERTLTINLTTTDRTPGGRSLHESSVAARLANCPQCWQRPGRPCTVSGPPGDHLARWQRAERRGLITRAELAAAVATLEVIAPHVIIRDGAL